MEAHQKASYSGSHLRPLVRTRFVDRLDDRLDRERSGQQFERAVVITTETQPNFTSGSAAWTPDEGQTWFELPQASGYWAVAFANPGAGWFVGNNGQIPEDQLLICRLALPHKTSLNASLPASPHGPVGNEDWAAEESEP